MSIHRRGARYQVKVRAHDGTWWTQTCERLEDARHVERAMLSARDRGENWKHPRDRPRGLTVRHVFEVFMRARRHELAASTRRRYGYRLETFVRWGEATHAPFLITKLSRPLLRAYYEHLLITGRKASTASKMVEPPQLAWSWAFEHDDEVEGWQDQVPRPRRLELPAATRRLTAAPTWAEMDDLVAALPPGWSRRAAIIQRFTGMRIGAVLQLEWRDLNLERRLLVVRPEISKGGYSGRIIPMASPLVAEVSSWSRDAATVCGPRSATYVGTDKPGKRFSAAWRRAKVPELVWSGAPTHAMRKGVYTNLLEAGAPHTAVKVLLGHQLSPVERAYADVTRAFNLDEVVVLIPAMGTTPGP